MLAGTNVHKTTNRWMYQKEVSMRVNLFPRSPLAAKIFIVLMLLLLLAGWYFGGRTVGGFSSLVFPFYQQLTVPDDGAVLTFHNDNQRTGQNLNETLLNTRNVNAQHFGKRVSYPVDGQVYAQPLVVPDVTLKGHHYHVVYVATEHDSVYAFDADQRQAVAPLWKRSFLHPPTVTTCSPTEVFHKDPDQDYHPYIGITSTPPFDLTTTTMLVVLMP